MQHFKTRMTKLKNLINRFPESGDIFGYQGVTKNVLLTALDTAYDLAQGINDDDAQNQLIIISLNRMEILGTSPAKGLKNKGFLGACPRRIRNIKGRRCERDTILMLE